MQLRCWKDEESKRKKERHAMVDTRFQHRYVVNEHLDVVWDPKMERVRTLVDGEPVIHCSFLIANISPQDDAITSIDDLAQLPGARVLEGMAVRNLLTIEAEVRAHASNIQQL
jgi:hypothetical protein